MSRDVIRRYGPRQVSASTTTSPAQPGVELVSSENIVCTISLTRPSGSANGLGFQFPGNANSTGKSTMDTVRFCQLALSVYAPLAAGA